MAEHSPQPIWDRRNNLAIVPELYNERTIRFFHQSRLGRLIYRLLLGKPVVSQLLALRDFTPWSRKKIPKFIKAYDLDPATFALPVEKFRTFNDFFTRELRPEYLQFDPGPYTLCSPCEAQLQITRCVSSSDTFTVKGVTFSITELLGNKDLAKQFSGGDLCSFYLAPQYYHRFHFPLDCEWRRQWVLGNRLFAVNDFSFRHGFRPFSVNVRHINLLWHPRLEDFLYIEVGATLVGKIQQHNPLQATNTDSTSRLVKKGDQKGFFSLGGSSILMIFRSGHVRFSPDVLEKNKEGLSVWVRPGEAIGRIAG